MRAHTDQIMLAVLINNGGGDAAWGKGGVLLERCLYGLDYLFIYATQLRM